VGMESREVDRNLRIVHCSIRKMENRSVDGIGPSTAPLLQFPMLQGVKRPFGVYLEKKGPVVKKRC